MKNDNSKLKNKIVLLIDTTSNKEIRVGLRFDGKTYWTAKKIGFQKAQVVLPMVDLMLTKHTLALAQIHSIEVNAGPGSFTGLRVGIAVANALGWTLSTAVNGRRQIVTPSYASSPVDRFH